MCKSSKPQPVKAPPTQTVVAPQFRYSFEEQLRLAQATGQKQVMGTRALQVPTTFSPYLTSTSALRIP